MTFSKSTRTVFLNWFVFSLFSLFLIKTVQANTLDVNSVIPTEQSSSVVLAGDKHYHPFHYLDTKGQPQGFDVELFLAIAEQEDLSTVVRLGSWDTKLRELESGTVDVIPMFISEKRQQRFLFSKPFLTRYHLIFGPTHSKYIPSLDALKGQRVAVQYGGLAWETLQESSTETITVSVNNESEALLAVARGQAEFALVPMAIGYGAIHRYKLKNIIAVSPLLLEREYAFAVTASQPDLVEAINEGLMQVQMRGEQDRLYIKWLANLVPPEESYRSGMLTGAWIVIPLLLCTIITFIWWRKARINAASEADRADKETASRQTAEARAEYLAFHDVVTGLPNRNAFDKAISRALCKAETCALVRLDIFGIDLLHVIAGNNLSQNLLKAIGERLVRQYGNDSVADLGHGKFVIKLEAVQNEQEAIQKTQVLINLVNERYHLKDLPIEIRCCAGVALSPHHDVDGDKLFRAAELACITAQASGAVWRMYEPALEPDARNLTLLADLQDAILDGTLGYAYQPQVDLKTNQIIGVELLVRWNHPRYGPLSPDIFIQLAERTGSIGQMTMYLVLKAIAQCQEWQKTGIDLSISINVSSNDLADELLVQTIIDSCEDVGHRIILEVTETEVMRDTERVLASVKALRAKSIRISLDDFGTGYSSFSYLQRLAPDELKIDQSFISNLTDSPKNQAIVRSTILLAHELDAKVVAEGIEDAQSRNFLIAHGCDIGQGYAIGRPMPLEELIKRSDLSRCG